MPRFRTKPVEIEARRFDDDGSETNASDLAAWCGGTIRTALARPTDPSSVTAYIDIRTLGGVMTADPGDWIIRSAKGEFYPCKPEIFSATCDPADAAAYRTLNPSTTDQTETTEEPS